MAEDVEWDIQDAARHLVRRIGLGVARNLVENEIVARWGLTEAQMNLVRAMEKIEHDTENLDMLTEMFRLQTELNAKYGFDKAQAHDDDQYAGEWIGNYIAAVQSELEELRDCTFWKHWHKEARNGRWKFLHDREHAKVEVVDLFFFVMSLAMVVGLTAPDVFRLYQAKLGINHKRRDEDMTTAEAHKTELGTDTNRERELETGSL
jgi:hypothetical protein